MYYFCINDNYHKMYYVKANRWEKQSIRSIEPVNITDQSLRFQKLMLLHDFKALNI